MLEDFILTLRMQEKGGTQLQEVHERLRPSGAPEWIIFIHGFNVDEPCALEQWETLRSNMAIGDVAGRVQCGIFLWPSDEYSNYSSYPKMIPQAEKAGRKLADYLGNHPASQVVLVGHSMGARVALQAAETLAGSSMELRGLVLLGAAVRAIDCERFEQYGRAHAAREAVGFSITDSTLKRWFRIGEKAAAPFAEIGEAVGHRGHPESRTWHRLDSRSNDHSYWKFKCSADLTAWALNPSGIMIPPPAPCPADRSPEERKRPQSCGS